MERVAVIGAGGLGCALLPRLARMSLDTLTLIDGDRVEVANLDRQPLYAEADAGHFKTDVALGWLRLMSDAELRSKTMFIDPGNARQLLADHDIVVEGVDDLHAKQLIDRTCADLRTPLVSGGVHRSQGQVIVLHTPGSGEELRRGDLFKGRAGSEQDGCDMRDVPLELLEEVGRAMAARVRAILRGEPVVNGLIDLFDLERRQWMSIDPPHR